MQPQILRAFNTIETADFEVQSSLLKNKLHPQIQIPTACTDNQIKLRCFCFLEKLGQLQVSVEAMICILYKLLLQRTLYLDDEASAPN